MGLLSNRVDRDTLKPGDHIYSWRNAYFYAHHGIYVGDNKVIHFTRQGQEVGTGTVLDVIILSSGPARSQVPCPTCIPPEEADGVVSSCLDCFLCGGGLYRFEYAVSPALFIAKARGGTCTLAVSDPGDMVVHRANYLLNNGFGCYNVFKNNCEDFAIYCKTGLLVLDQSTMGQSGQAAAIIGGPLAAVFTSPLRLVTKNVYGMVATAVGVYCVSRYAADIGMRKDVHKMAVEDLTRSLATVTVPPSLCSRASSIPVLDGSNFKEWYEHVQFTLGELDLDMALLVENPAGITADSTVEQVALVESWKRSNRLSLMFMRMTITNNIKTSLIQTDNALEFLKAVEDRFKSADKSLASTLMVELTTIKYDGNRGVQDHILNMTDKAAKLGTLGMQVDESFLVQCILNSLPSQFGPFKIHYNTNKEKWNLDELTSMCVHEEVRLKGEEHHNVAIVTHGAINKSENYKKFKKNSSKKGKGPGEGNQAYEGFIVKCYFCGKKGHMKKDCGKRKAWFEKKGIPFKPETKRK